MDYAIAVNLKSLRYGIFFTTKHTKGTKKEKEAKKGH